MTDRLAELQEKKDALVKARALAALAFEEQKLELELKYEEELGPRGSMFDMLDLTNIGEGFIVLKLAEGVVHNKFIASKQTEVDLDNFIRPSVVHPAKEVYAAIMQRRPGVAHQCANVLLSLYGLKANEDAKKQ